MPTARLLFSQAATRSRSAARNPGMRVPRTRRSVATSRSSDGRNCRTRLAAEKSGFEPIAAKSIEKGANLLRDRLRLAGSRYESIRPADGFPSGPQKYMVERNVTVRSRHKRLHKYSEASETNRSALYGCWWSSDSGRLTGA